MKKILLVALLLSQVVSLADDIGKTGGIEELNFEVNAHHINHEVSSQSYQAVSAVVNIPVYSYIGSSIGIYTTNEQDYNYFTVNDTGIDGELFIRDYNVGKIGVSAGYTDIDVAFSNDLNLTSYESLFPNSSYRYSLYGEYYLDDFTFSAGYSSVKYDDGYDYSNSRINGSLYIQDNTKVLIGIEGGDSSNSFILGAYHQLNLLDNSIGVSATYFNNDSTYKNDRLIFSLSYYFTSNISLKNRDRKYR